MKERISGWQRVGSQLVFILYLGVLFYLLFFSERYGRTDASEEYHYNLVLFKEIRRFYQYREILGMQSVLVNLVGNVVAFMPFGFFLPVIWSYPLFLGSWILINFKCLFKRDTTWDKIEHIRKINIGEVSTEKVEN